MSTNKNKNPYNSWGEITGTGGLVSMGKDSFVNVSDPKKQGAMNLGEAYKGVYSGKPADSSGDAYSSIVDVSTPAGSPNAPTGIQDSVINGDAYTGIIPTTTENGEAEPETTQRAEKLSYADWLTSQKESLLKMKNDALAVAEARKKEQVADAYSAYVQNRAGYGANAEALGRMGLSGSGYSDYLDSQAYAQHRSDISAAEKEYGTAEREAESAYNQGVYNLNNTAEKRREADEDAAKQAYSSLYEYAASGVSIDQLKNHPDYASLTDEQKAYIDSAAEIYKTETRKTTYDAALADAATGTLTASQIDVYAKINGWTDEERLALYDAVQKYNASNGIDSSIEDTNAYQNAVLKSGDSDKIEAERKIWSDDTLANEFLTSADLSTTEGAEALFDTFSGIMAAPLTDEKLKTDVFDILNRNYGAVDVTKLAESYNQADTWGSYSGYEDDNSEQTAYTYAIVSAAKNGDIKAGQYVKMNYGEVDEDAGVYMYLGEGMFVKVDHNTSGMTKGSFYVPEGFKLNKKDSGWEIK